ncbi:MAG TPA: hypothetical protein VMV02_06520 [Acidimicrobiales bacterium]|nr:hypothetical protein [Acidimicrobiales bacterium]
MSFERHDREPLAAMLPPGNAGSNGAAHHAELLGRTLSVLPSEYRDAPVARS